MLDHLLAVVFAVGFPVVTAPVYARRRASLRANDSAVRRREYVETIVWLSCMGLATLAVWRAADREWSALGLGFEWSGRAGLSLLAATVIGTLLCLQVRAVRRDTATRDAARLALEPVREYLPTTRAELRLFRGVSVAAGVGEELFYRGFLIWYLSHLAPIAVAVGLSSVLFGLAHVVHGAKATSRATVLGFVLAGLYLFSGSLWASMLLHTAIDLTSGETGVAVFGEGPSTVPTTPT